MFVMDGYEFIKQLCFKYFECDEIFFIFFLVLVDRDNVFEGMKFGFDDYMIKLIDYGMFFIKVDMCL